MRSRKTSFRSLRKTIQFIARESDGIALEIGPRLFDLLADEQKFSPQASRKASVANHGEIELARCELPLLLGEGRGEGLASPAIAPHLQPFSQREKGDHQRLSVDRTEDKLVSKLFSTHLAFFHGSSSISGRHVYVARGERCCLKQEPDICAS